MSGFVFNDTATTERRAHDALAKGFGPGFNGPLVVMVGARDPQAAVRDLRAKIADTPGVVFVSPAQVGRDTALFTAIPATAPTDERALDLVERLRDEPPGIGIAGPTA